jgi:hypothetical protein
MARVPTAGKALIDRARRDAEAVLTRHWFAVERIADASLRRPSRRLNGSEVECLFYSPET